MATWKDIADFGQTTRRDIVDLFLGRKIGSGCARDVYECAFDSRSVIKVESKYASFQNVSEWKIWEALRDTPQARWLAPCIAISATGSVLLMRKTEPLQEKQLPKKMPAWLTDFHMANYGMLDGRVVCHDYGVADSVVIGMGASKRMKKPDWVELR